MESYTIRRYLPATIAASVAIVTVAFSPWAAQFSGGKDLFHGSAPEQSSASSVAADDETLGSVSTSYTSATLGYRIHYPTSWTMDDNHQDAAIDILKDPKGLFTVTIGNTLDPYLCMPWEIGKIRAAMERSAALDPTIMLWNAEITKLNGNPAVATVATRTVGGERWKLRTFAVARPEKNDTLNVFIAVRSDVETLFAPRMQEILNSLEVEGGGY